MNIPDDTLERLGWLDSVDRWLAARQWRNQMVHEYLEAPVVLADALQAGHDTVAMLVGAATAMCMEIKARGWSHGASDT